MPVSQKPDLAERQHDWYLQLLIGLKTFREQKVQADIVCSRHVVSVCCSVKASFFTGLFHLDVQLTDCRKHCDIYHLLYSSAAAPSYLTPSLREAECVLTYTGCEIW